MKEKMINYLDDVHWSSGRDYDIIKEFIDDFFNEYRPERLSEKTPQGDAIV